MKTLVAERPKPNIFRLYNENHQATLDTMKIPPQPASADFIFPTETNAINHLTEQPLLQSIQTTVVPLLAGQATTGNARDEMTKIFDVNDCLADGNVAGAEHRMGREITTDEIVARRVTSGRTLVGAESDHVKALMEAKKEILKQRILKNIEKQKRLQRMYFKLAKAREKRLTKHATNQRDRLTALDRFNPIFANIEWDISGEQDESGLESILEKQIDTIETMQDAIETIEDPPVPAIDADDDDDRSIAATLLDDSRSVAYASDDESVAATEIADDRVRLRLGQPGGYFDDASSATTANEGWVREPKWDIDERKGPEPAVNYDDNGDNIRIGMLDPQAKYTNAQLKQRAGELRQKYPSLKTRGSELANISVKPSELRAKIIAVEAKIRAGTLKEGKGLAPKKKSDAPKNPDDYRGFGPRFFINTKKLKSGEFSLCHPSGQKPMNIRNANLTPALRELVEAYLEGAPMDTSSLSDEERRWYTFIWEECKLKRKPKLPIGEKKSFTKKWCQSRWRVLVGQVESGNDSPQIITELEELVDNMERRNYLDRPEINKLREFIALSK